MKVGIPSEVKNNEFRVAITPAGVNELRLHDHEVYVQRDAGLGSSITNEEYIAAGATILHGHFHHFSPNGGVSGVLVAVAAAPDRRVRARMADIGIVCRHAAIGIERGAFDEALGAAIGTLDGAVGDLARHKQFLVYHANTYDTLECGFITRTL